MPRNYLILVWFICSVFMPGLSHAQTQITQTGNYITDIYTLEMYQAHSQNWAIAQDSMGRMYFGNSNGLLVYNGHTWEFFETQNKSLVRSIYLKNKRIYVGAQNEFGYFEPNSTGNLIFHTLTSLLPDSVENFNDVWSIREFGNAIYFQTNNYIFEYKSDTITTRKAKGFFSVIFIVGSHMYIHDSEKGLYKYSPSKVSFIPESDKWFKERLFFILPHSANKLWIGTRGKGIIELNGDTLRQIKTQADDYLKTNVLYLCSKYSDDFFLLNTMYGGMLVLDTMGNIKRIFTKKDGLADNAVYYNYTDSEGNIWLAHENGISHMKFNSPLTNLSEIHNITSIPFSINKIDNQLLISLNKGVYSYNLTPNIEPWQQTAFEPYYAFPSRIWDIKYLDDKLFFVGDKKIFIKDGNKEISFDENIYSWKIEKIKNQVNKYWIFTQQGIRRLELIDNNWILSNTIPGFNENSRYTDIDQRGNIWITENNNGIFKITPNDSFNISDIQIFGKEHGINDLSSIRCMSLGDRVIVSAGKQIYEFDEKNKHFNRKRIFLDTNDSIEGEITFRYREPNKDAIWCGYNGRIALLQYRGDSLKLTTLPYRLLPKMNLLPSFYSDSSALYIGYPKQLYSYDMNFLNRYHHKFQAFLTKISGIKSDTIFLDQFYNVSQIPELKLSYDNNSLRFEFASPYFQGKQATQFSYMLVGEDNNWSQYSSSVYKDYTNLTEGRYAFMVKARNVFGIETEPAVVYFTIDPPFYRHTLAYFVYTLLAILLIYIIVKLNTRTLKRTNTELEKRVEMRTQKIFEQKEELRKQNNELTKLSAIASETSNAVSVFNQSGNLEWINDGFIKMYGYTLEELIYNADSNITSFCPPYIAEAILKRKQAEYESFSYEMQRNTKQNTKLWVKSTLTPLFDDLGNLYSIIAIDTDISELKIAESIIINAKDEIQTQRDELIHQNKFIQMQNDDIQAAIRYAKTIQEAILPAQTVLDEFYDNFIIYIPKDIVSGDFYWFHSMVLEREIKLETQNEKKQILELKPNTRLDFLIVADFTGHGVPGAFMSLIGSQLFTEIIIEKKEYLPSQILNLINQDIRKALKQDITNNTDGMDVGICLLIHTADSTPVIYAGSKRPFYIRKSSNMELLKTKGDSSSIGGYYTRVDADFTDFVTELNDNDVIYMSSDGFIDQNGEKRKRYGSPRFEILLKEIGNKTMPDQKQILLQELREFMSDLPQRDDITLIGIKKHSPK